MILKLSKIYILLKIYKFSVWYKKVIKTEKKIEKSKLKL